MKYTSLAVLSVIAFSQMTLAQTTCAAQEVFDKCLIMEDEYLKTCKDQEYACLCKWHRAKLTCYDNCPNNVGKESQQGLRDTFCSIADTYSKNVSSSSLVPSVAAATNLPSQSGPVPIPVSSATNTATNPATTENAKSSSTSNYHYYSQGALMCIAGVTTYFLI